MLQPLRGPSVILVCHPWFTTSNLSYRFPIFETSAIDLCGTTGIQKYIYIYIYIEREIDLPLCTFSNTSFPVGNFRDPVPIGSLIPWSSPCHGGSDMVPWPIWGNPFLGESRRTVGLSFCHLFQCPSASAAFMYLWTFLLVSSDAMPNGHRDPFLRGKAVAHLIREDLTAVDHWTDCVPVSKGSAWTFAHMNWIP